MSLQDDMKQWMEALECSQPLIRFPENVARHEAAITSLRARIADGGWMPIESAPKDGSPILLGFAGSHSEEGYWMGDASRNHYGETGWFAADDDVLCSHPIHPTHWQPLPPAPKEKDHG